MLNIQDVQKQFPQLKVAVRGGRLVYLDSAATTLKPQAVIDRITQVYSSEVSNVHRGAHDLSDRATVSYENARETVRKFINASSSNEIIFTKGTTESINLVAQSFGHAFLNEGDEILLTEMEHHSNIVPWQLIAKEKGAKIVAAPITPQGEIDLEGFKKKLSKKTKIVSFCHISNALGTINPVSELIRMAKEVGAVTVIDAAQSVSAEAIDVQKLGCDFLAFSGHKLFGPNGIGVLFGRQELLNKMPPYQGGGSMIGKVTFANTTFLEAPQRFEAGTPPVAEAIALASAIQYFQSLGLENIKAHKKNLLTKATIMLKEIPSIQLIGEAKNKTSVISFLMKGAHPSDVGPLLDQQGIAVRCGHHCNQPLMDVLKIPGTVRASFSIYNSEDDIEVLRKGLMKAQEILL